ncbi:hypothetical protein [Nocardioides sp. B-3]|uniref:hypothetical protein n=1 Tax=Nocardioides sp. B-3 TaxID=2895565 RepID=UPI0021537842|nr:hypothetical protein [Nocardioides sp. B-3]UUZ59333.1 hypothetical protein LP418_26355 [Nocardioides sp. B-3]
MKLLLTSGAASVDHFRERVQGLGERLLLGLLGLRGELAEGADDVEGDVGAVDRDGAAVVEPFAADRGQVQELLTEQVLHLHLGPGLVTRGWRP